MSFIESPKLQREISGDGPLDAKILVITHMPSWNDKPAKRPFSDASGKLLFDQFFKAGITRSRVRTESICERVPPARKYFLLDSTERDAWASDCLDRISKLSPNVIVPVGEEALRLVTDKTGIGKWQLSILEGFQGKKVVPLHHPDYIMAVYKEIPFITFGAQRVFEQSQFPEIRRVERNFIIHPTVEQTLAWINSALDSEYLSFDIETGAGQITCIGFATHPKEAICIPTLPKDYSSADFYRLWRGIAELLSSKSKKVAQNWIYDATYLSRYGIRVRNLYHDTMVCQKFLHPELPMGLDTIARLYTEEPYWKDEGKDWGQRANIDQLYYYNCKDAACTLEAALGQKVDLKQRNLERLFYERQMAYTASVLEMSWTGLTINQEKRSQLRDTTVAKIETLQKDLDEESVRLLGDKINVRSHAEVKNLLRAAGYKLPVIDGKESSDKHALLKLRLKDPESKILTPLIRISEENKKLSSFINYTHDSDNVLRYTLYNHGTESARWSSGKDPWDRGLNAQTVPAKLRPQFIAPLGRTFIEVDLKQAESRFVAWDGPVPKLIQMYLDGIDIHRYVASHPLLFNKPIEKITKDERQLGKKTGHAANYGMRGSTLSDSCLKEMDLVLSIHKADQMLEGYHAALDNGVRRWQQKIQEEVRRTRKLRTPVGYERYFYDRISDDLFREAYSYKPQNVVVFVLNELMLRMYGYRNVWLHNQIHDALLFSVPDEEVLDALERVKDQDAWNPTLKLAGGEMRIPIDAQMGKVWKEMETVFEG
jgi:uracil-DNA glycosylase family 4